MGSMSFEFEKSPLELATNVIEENGECPISSKKLVELPAASLDRSNEKNPGNPANAFLLALSCSTR